MFLTFILRVYTLRRARPVQRSIIHKSFGCLKHFAVNTCVSWLIHLVIMRGQFFVDTLFPQKRLRILSDLFHFINESSAIAQHIPVRVLTLPF